MELPDDLRLFLRGPGLPCAREHDLDFVAPVAMATLVHRPAGVELSRPDNPVHKTGLPRGDNLAAGAEEDRPGSVLPCRGGHDAMAGRHPHLITARVRRLDGNNEVDKHWFQ